MFKINEISFEVVKTWVFQGEVRNDPRDGMVCVELKSADGRYSLTTDAESLAPFVE